MAEVNSIPNDHHVVRYCEGRLIDRDDSAGVREIFPQAFALRSGINETYLSCSYYETFDGSYEARMLAVLDALETRIKSSRIKSQDGLVFVNVGEVRACGATRNLNLRVLHEPKKDKLDYAAIRGIPHDQDDELCTLLAALAVRDVVIVSELR